MNDGQHIGGRYGIWGINPYGPTIKRTPLLEGIFNAADRTGKILKQGYENQQEGSKAQLMRDTLESEIGAKNARNQADERYYPQQQALKTQQEAATIKEIMARTGVSFAQAKHIAAQTGLVNSHRQAFDNPFFQTNNMVKQWESLPNDSPQKMMLGRLLDSELGGMFTPGSKNKTSNAGISAANGMFPGLGGPWMRDPKFGTSRGGQGGTYTNPQTGEVISTDTNANTTQDQKTIAAAQRVIPLIEEIATKQAPFMTLGGRGRLLSDKISNLFGANKQSPSDAATVEANAELSAEGLLKAYGLNTTDQSANMMKAAIKPILGESAASYKKRLYKTLDTIKENQKQAGFRLKEGTEVGKIPATPASMGYFSSHSVSNPSVWGLQEEVQNAAPQAQQQAPTQQQQQPMEPAQLNAWAEEAIAKGAPREAVMARLQQMQGGGQ